jgi:hypothetical protein
MRRLLAILAAVIASVFLPLAAAADVYVDSGTAGLNAQGIDCQTSTYCSVSVSASTSGFFS